MHVPKWMELMRDDKAFARQVTEAAVRAPDRQAFVGTLARLCTARGLPGAEQELARYLSAAGEEARAGAVRPPSEAEWEQLAEALEGAQKKARDQAFADFLQHQDPDRLAAALSSIGAERGVQITAQALGWDVAFSER